MKKKLMQITHDLAIGGLQQVVVNICRSINREKFDISILCLKDGGEYLSEVDSLGIKVFHLPHKIKGTDYFSFLKVAKILRQEKIEIIHTHNTQPFFDGTIGAMLSGVNTIVHTDHARDFPDKYRYMLAERVISHFAYKIVGVSDHTAYNLMKYEKINKNKIVTIENGIDGSKYEIKIDRDRKRKELGIANAGPIIGLGVRLTKQKGISYLLQAMPQLIKLYPGITLVIAGDGDQKIPLQNVAKQLNIDGHVIFLGARLDIPQLLKLFDIYVLPSLWEGLPLVLLEALAAECPIIATNVGGINKLIENNSTGLLVDSKDSKQLSLAIIKMLNDDKFRNSCILSGKELFNKKFSADIMTRKYERLYDRHELL